MSKLQLKEEAERDWNERKDKIAAVLDVLRYILAPPAPATYEEISRRCIRSDAYARLLFEEIGKVKVPDHARVVFLNTSQYNQKEKGSLIIEMPPSTLQVIANTANVINYVHEGCDPPPASVNKRKWENVNDKSAAIEDVLRHIFTQPNEVRERCLKDDEFAAELFRDSRIGNINVPGEAKVVFVPSGERVREIRGSLVIVVPPPSAANGNDDELLRYVMCCYRLW